MSVDLTPVSAYASSALAELANPQKARDMAAYMKTDMPFYGVQMPQRRPIARRLVKEFVPATREEYEQLVLALWSLPHREEKYLALAAAGGHRHFITSSSLPLYQRLIVEGAWWDLVDEIAIDLVGRVVLATPEDGWKTVDGWIDDPFMWLRRSAIICQVGAKDRTDEARLLRFCLARIDEKEFFIRKAIGWALREYAKTSPDSVAGFVTANREELSGLSFREATKHIGHLIG